MSYRETIDGYLRRFGELVGVELEPLNAEGHSSVQRGSATVGINVLEDHRVLMFLSPIMRVPRRRPEELYRKLLELNFLGTSDAAFAIDREKNVVYLRALRGLEGLDFEEFVDLLDTMGSVADEWDEKLRAEFGD
ncbi:MAG: YbjN domain-containing protein [Deltaproteobacteria bacterium]|nr:YbjN domain-containing protein [Deltaproteobacteria bacterium]